MQPSPEVCMMTLPDFICSPSHCSVKRERVGAVEREREQEQELAKKKQALFSSKVLFPALVCAPVSSVPPSLPPSHSSLALLFFTLLSPSPSTRPRRHLHPRVAKEDNVVFVLVVFSHSGVL